MENSQNGQPTFKLSVSQMDKALRDVHDLFERCLIPTNWLLLGETARDIKEGFDLRSDKITVGVSQKYLTEYVMSTLKYYVKDEFTDKGFTYVVDGVPIEVKFIKRKYQWFTNPDFRFHMGDTFFLPNPFDKYWKARFIVQ